MPRPFKHGLVVEFPSGNTPQAPLLKICLCNQKFPSLEVIYSAHTTEGVDPAYLRLFAGTDVRPGVFFDFVIHYNCVNVLIHRTYQDSLTILETELEALECKDHLRTGLPLTRMLYNKVVKAPTSNKYKEAVLKFLDFLKMHQNLLTIENLIHF